MKILIIGGTGMLGRPVAEQMAADGCDITIMSSHPEQARQVLNDKFRIVPGDVTDIESLKRAIDGHEAVYINLNSKLDPELYQRIEIEGTANVARVAAELGVKRIGNISGASSRGVETGQIFRDAKVRAERALIESGIEYVIMRASWFYESVARFIKDGQPVILGEQPVKFGWLDSSDFAKQVSRAFQIDKAANNCFYNLGPEKMTIGDAVTRYCANFHPGTQLRVVPFEQARKVAEQNNDSAMMRSIEFFEYFSTNDEDVDQTETDRILGPNTTSLEQWMDKQA